MTRATNEAMSTERVDDTPANRSKSAIFTTTNIFQLLPVEAGLYSVSNEIAWLPMTKLIAKDRQC